MTIHDFHERRAFGDSAANEPFWQAAFRRAFPGYVGMTANPDGNEANRRGIDRWIALSNGLTVRVDLKTREREWPDIALEYASAGATSTLGWVEKDLAIDYLCYGFLSTGRAYLFPWPALRRAWLKNRRAWFAAASHPHPSASAALSALPAGRNRHDGRDGFALCRAPNFGYDTLSLAVPIAVLRREIASALTVQLPDSEWDGGVDV